MKKLLSPFYFLQDKHLNMEQSQYYLNQLAPGPEAYNLELQITDQNDRVLKGESKNKKLLDYGVDLDKKRIKIAQKIADNKLDQEMQIIELTSRKQALTVLVEQR